MATLVLRVAGADEPVTTVRPSVPRVSRLDPPMPTLPEALVLKVSPLIEKGVSTMVLVAMLVELKEKNTSSPEPGTVPGSLKVVAELDQFVPPAVLLQLALTLWPSQ
jgi:hypothetical protein